MTGARAFVVWLALLPGGALAEADAAGAPADLAPVVPAATPAPTSALRDASRTADAPPTEPRRETAAGAAVDVVPVAPKASPAPALRDASQTTDAPPAAPRRETAAAKNLPGFTLFPPPARRPHAPLAAPRPDAGPNKAAHVAAAARPPRPRRRVPPSCTADGAFCIAPVAFTRDVCRVIEGVADEAGIDPHFFARLVWRESLFDPYAVSPAGALGIAQFMPETARLRGLEDPFDPARALRASALYLAELAETFGNLGLAAVAYNGGEARAARFVDGAGGLPAETRDYVRAITGLSAERWRDDPPARPSPALAADTAFQVACVQKASSQGLRGPDAATGQWWMIFVADPDPVAAARRAAALRLKFPVILAEAAPDGSTVHLRRARLPGRAAPYYTAGIGHPTQNAARAHCAVLRRAGGGCMVLRD